MAFLCPWLAAFLFAIGSNSCCWATKSECAGTDAACLAGDDTSLLQARVRKGFAQEGSHGARQAWRSESVTCNVSKVDYCIQVYGNRTAKYRFVLLHGFPDFGQSWMWYLLPEMRKRAFSDDFQFIAPDLRGVGCTQSPGRVMEAQKEFYDHNNMIQDLKDIWKHYGFGRGEMPWVIAHDWGAALGWNLYFRNPEMVAGFVGMSVPPMYHNQLKQLDPRLQAIDTYYDSFKFNQHFWADVITTPLYGHNATGPEAFAVWFPGPGRRNDARELFSHPHPESLGSHIMWYQYPLDQHSSDDGSEPRTQCDPEDRDISGACKPFEEKHWPLAGYIGGAKDFWLNPKRMACCSSRKMPRLKFDVLPTDHFVPHDDPASVSVFIEKMVLDPDELSTLHQFCEGPNKTEYWTAETQSFCPAGGGKVEPNASYYEDCKKECPVAVGALESCITSRLGRTATMNGRCVASYCKNIAAYEMCLRTQPACKFMTDFSAAYGVVVTSHAFLNLTICNNFTQAQLIGLDGQLNNDP
uniref:AB hydrolase-1 domain-containing protein n=1 Tax=Zooxanthella nutricula TaxID=1333877 RepID=A0A7S2KFT8_9DINO